MLFSKKKEAFSIQYNETRAETDVVVVVYIVVVHVAVVEVSVPRVVSIVLRRRPIPVGN